MLKLSTILSRLHACDGAQDWAKAQPDLQTAWRECRRSDWMIWLLACTTVDQDDPRLWLMACDFAEAALIYVPAGEDRPRRAIEVSRRFAAGEATREEMAAAWAAASAAARAAARAARDAVGDAALAARDAVGDAAQAAQAASQAAASYAAWAARDAVGDAVGDAAWDAAWAACAAAWAAQSDIVRRYFLECPGIKRGMIGKDA